MKHLLLALLLFTVIGTKTKAQSEDCRTKLEWGGYSNGAYQIWITNKMPVSVSYLITYPNGANISTAPVFLPPGEWLYYYTAPFSPGEITVKPITTYSEPCPVESVEVHFLFEHISVSEGE